MNKPARSSLARSFERHMRAENRSDRTIATYLHGLRQAETFLRARGTTVEAATRADLEAFMADLLARCTASTASTAGAYHKVLKSLYGWLAEEEAIPNQPGPVRRLVTRMGEHSGAPGRTWTSGLRLRTPALCPLSHKGKGVALVETAGSNLRRRRCQRRALPAELRPVWLV